MSDEFLVAIPIPPPIRGLLEGLDPALAEEFFPNTAAQDLQNIRVAGGRWATRAGFWAITREQTRHVLDVDLGF